jgi:hypothetical protein
MRRYERVSTLLSSNRPVEDWGKLLGDVAAVSAMLDEANKVGSSRRVGDELEGRQPSCAFHWSAVGIVDWPKKTLSKEGSARSFSGASRLSAINHRVNPAKNKA